MFHLSSHSKHPLASIRQTIGILKGKMVACILVFSVVMNFPIVYFSRSLIEAVLEIGEFACFVFIVWGIFGAIVDKQLGRSNRLGQAVGISGNAFYYAAWSAILYWLIGCVIALVAIYLRQHASGVAFWLGPPPRSPKL